MKKKFKLAKSVAIAYFVYSMVTDIAIWTTALLYFINKGFQPFKNAACEDAKNLDFSGFLARVRQQQCDDDAFGGPCARISAKARNVKSFLRVWTKLNKILQVLRQQQCDDDFLQRCPRHYTRNGVACQVFFARMQQIVYNQTSLRNGDDNCRKLGQMCEKFLTKRPRARPPEIRLCFLHEYSRNHLTTHGVPDIMYA